MFLKVCCPGVINGPATGDHETGSSHQEHWHETAHERFPRVGLDTCSATGEVHKRAGLLSAVLRTRAHFEDEHEMRARAMDLLGVFGLGALSAAPAASLSYGDQRRLEIARAMMTAPKLLLLDEPAAGMNTREADGLMEQVRWLREKFGVAVVLVEHNMRVVMGVCEEIHVLDHGETIAHGAPADIRTNAKVLGAYLGEEGATA